MPPPAGPAVNCATHSVAHCAHVPLNSALPLLLPMRAVGATAASGAISAAMRKCAASSKAPQTVVGASSCAVLAAFRHVVPPKPTSHLRPPSRASVHSDAPPNG